MFRNSLVAAAICTLMVSQPSAVHAQQCPTYLLKWGSVGSGIGQFRFPNGMGIDSAGNIYVADRLNSVVHKFTNDGVFLASLGGPSAGLLVGPSDVAVSPTGDIFVTQPNAARVDVFDASLAFMRRLAITAESITLDPSGAFLFGTSWPGILTKYGAVDGTTLGTWTYTGSQDFKAYGFSVGASGTVYIADPITHSVCTIDTNRDCWGNSQVFRSPGPVLVDPQETVIQVGDNLYARAFDLATKQQGCVWASNGLNDGQFTDVPDDIVMDAQGNLFLLDTSLARVQKFSASATPARATSWGRLKSTYR